MPGLEFGVNSCMPWQASRALLHSILLVQERLLVVGLETRVGGLAACFPRLGFVKMNLSCNITRTGVEPCFCIQDAIDKGLFREHASPSSAVCEQTIAATARDIAEALSCLHRAGILHCDVSGGKFFVFQIAKNGIAHDKTGSPLTGNWFHWHSAPRHEY